MCRFFSACKKDIDNRGKAPDSFLNELVEWAKTAPDEIFIINNNYDIYSDTIDVLGPWEDLTHRKAVMLEVLRVLGGFESSWDWNAGRDTTNPASNTFCTEETGIFQCSGDSLHFDITLKELFRSISNITDCKTFISTSKENHTFAIEYCARLLRFTTKHHGPIKRKEIHKWLNKDAVLEFKNFIVN